MMFDIVCCVGSRDGIQKKQQQKASQDDAKYLHNKQMVQFHH